MNKIKGNIILTGFMGAGKTEVARVLSKKTGLNFIDMDEEIEKKENMSISKIFNSKGESYFRELEHDFLNELEKHIKKGLYEDRHIVLSTGGGVPVQPGNIKILKKIGFVVYLAAVDKTIYERIKHKKNRPVLGTKGFTLKNVAEKLNERERFYKQADLIIHTDNVSIESVAGQIEIFHQAPR